MIHDNNQTTERNSRDSREIVEMIERIEFSFNFIHWLIINGYTLWHGACSMILQKLYINKLLLPFHIPRSLQTFVPWDACAACGCAAVSYQYILSHKPWKNKIHGYILYQILWWWRNGKRYGQEKQIKKWKGGIWIEMTFS